MVRCPKCVALPLLLGSLAAVADEPPELLIRIDDIGMNHTVNSAMRDLLQDRRTVLGLGDGALPWFPEAAKVLQANPQISVGIHLTLNSEWADYRWGPVLGASTVPSLVDENGYFFHTAAQLFEHGMDIGQVKSELRAQIEQALRAGLDVDYLDYHMLTAISTPELRAVVEELAQEFGVGLSQYFGEPSVSLWDVEPDRKLVTLLDAVEQARPGEATLVVLHLGEETPEMNALVDANNPLDPFRVALHRAEELDAITSPAFIRAAEARGIRFVTYEDVVERHGLNDMRAPEATGYSTGADPISPARRRSRGGGYAVPRPRSPLAWPQGSKRTPSIVAQNFSTLPLTSVSSSRPSALYWLPYLPRWIFDSMTMLRQNRPFASNSMNVWRDLYRYLPICFQLPNDVVRMVGGVRDA